MNVSNNFKSIDTITLKMEEMDSSAPPPPVLTFKESEKEVKDEIYFDSYEDLEVHKVMLEDKPRMTAYKDAILKNKEYFKDKVVMDVGCGTGVLAIFCAQAGAKKVYAVEASNIAKLAEEIVAKNEFQNIIQVIHSKVEDVELPNNIKVDAIVSEWMGFFLLHEGMLDSVIAARDKFLKPDGLMFPQSAAIYVAPCSVPKLYNFWKDYEGIDMSPFGKCLRRERHIKPEIMTIKKEDLMGKEEVLCWVNLTEDKVTDLDSYSLQHVVGASKEGDFQGLCLWFECNFPNGVVLDTSPRSEPTHWQQTVIVLPESNIVDEGEPLAFKLEMARDSDNPRRYNIIVEVLEDYESVDHPIPCSCYMTKCILVKQLMASHEEHAKENVEIEKEKRMSIGPDDV